ncbi:hypothetical protein PWEIH_12470 [Listeria weihenstephanensis FSL R9-0317]|uniref:Uncharacterized protein n=1 Tax=Listeria weihenstephanensis TaxID=1006155 RepID=A0A1S7FRV2_9LIST|nr:hypothetical protein [Listeria weihenstephanensis]AQY50130.1 hypothetical protein UE46_03155 [Listeria weihenstephanensis]EUJ36608.1 hypothetical protein PWEIH_12470 [Listeria weihenstephanensis FSL R9-0317]
MMKPIVQAKMASTQPCLFFQKEIVHDLQFFSPVLAKINLVDRSSEDSKWDCLMLAVFSKLDREYINRKDYILDQFPVAGNYPKYKMLITYRGYIYFLDTITGHVGISDNRFMVGLNRDKLYMIVYRDEALYSKSLRGKSHLLSQDGMVTRNIEKTLNENEIPHDRVEIAEFVNSDRASEISLVSVWELALGE